MKYNLYLLFLLFPLIGLTQETECSRKTNFGDVEICLPTIDGYEESYLDSIVMLLADGTEVPINKVLGFYLNKATYSKKDSIGQFTFDDYFKIYGTKSIKDHEADPGFVKEMLSLVSKDFIEKNWDTFSKEIDEIGLDIEFGVPALINSYQLNDSSFTMIMVMKYQTQQGDSLNMVMAINGLLIKQRLIWMAYYLKHENESSLEKIQNKSNDLLVQLLKANQ